MSHAPGTHSFPESILAPALGAELFLRSLGPSCKLCAVAIMGRRVRPTKSASAHHCEAQYVVGKPAPYLPISQCFNRQTADADVARRAQSASSLCLDGTRRGLTTGVLWAVI